MFFPYFSPSIKLINSGNFCEILPANAGIYRLPVRAMFLPVYDTFASDTTLKKRAVGSQVHALVVNM
jgi:hypothetical protein